MTPTYNTILKKLSLKGMKIVFFLIREKIIQKEKTCEKYLYFV